jgi:hypothetical protein
VSDIEFRSLEEVFVVKDLIPWDRAILRDAGDSTLVRDLIGGER